MFDIEENLMFVLNVEIIVGYWVLFFGIKYSIFIQVLEFKYCEEEKLWFCVEFIIFVSVIVVVNDDVSDSEVSSDVL